MTVEKIAILTTFNEFVSGYSLTGIVEDQIKMLRKYGHEVHLFVNEQFRKEDENKFKDVILHKQIPFSHLIDYESILKITKDHKSIIQKTTTLFKEQLKDIDIVFTHDFILTGWNLPYGIACIEASEQLEKTRWMHWIHSIPSCKKDWWYSTWFGNRHKIIFPNSTDVIRVAEQYRGDIKDVRTIRHIKDLRTWFDFDLRTIEIIDKYPLLMQADIVQIFPASVDRLGAKGVLETLIIFSELKKRQVNVCLLIANQWATGKKEKEKISYYKNIARNLGLVVGEEIIFTSDIKPEYEVGIPKVVIRELFQLSNLFIFPTKGESFGLVVPEAALAGGVLLVLNRSLLMQKEIAGENCLFFDFGSYDQPFKPERELIKYYRDLASLILGRMTRNESIKSKTFARQFYNYDYLYNQEYMPVIAESKIW